MNSVKVIWGKLKCKHQSCTISPDMTQQFESIYNNILVNFENISTFQRIPFMLTDKSSSFTDNKYIQYR